MGYTNLADYEGGKKEWVESGYPTETLHHHPPVTGMTLPPPTSSVTPALTMRARVVPPRASDGALLGAVMLMVEFAKTSITAPLSVKVAVSPMR